MSKHYDLIAIGGGSGGLSVAERAAKYGNQASDVGRLCAIELGLSLLNNLSVQ